MSELLSMLNFGLNTNMVFGAALILMAIALLGFAGWLMYDYFSFNYFVMIIDKRGRTSLKLQKKGKVVKTKEGLRFRIKGINSSIALPDNKYFFATYGFMKKGFITFYRFGENSFTPADMAVNFKNDGTEEIVDLNPIEQDLSEIRNLLNELDKKYSFEEFWERWGNTIIHLTMTGAVIGVQLLIFLMLKEFIPALTSASGQLELATSRMAGACEMANPSIVTWGGG